MVIAHRLVFEHGESRVELTVSHNHKTMAIERAEAVWKELGEVFLLPRHEITIKEEVKRS